jgi:hypothetical protein
MTLLYSILLFPASRLQEIIKYCTRVSSCCIFFLELIHDARNDEHKTEKQLTYLLIPLHFLHQN